MFDIQILTLNQASSFSKMLFIFKMFSESRISLFFRNTSPEFLVTLKDYRVSQGKDVSLEVVVSGEPRPNVQWFMENRLLTSKNNRHVIVSKGSVFRLDIKNIQVEDEGVYECVAANTAGSKKCDCEVIVDG